MKLYNTLTRALQELKPLDGKEIRIYSCGPTVYDYAHIGNLSAFIFADTLRRAVRIAGYDVRHVMNYTDVDDKTIRRSRQDYPDDTPDNALQKLTDKFIGVFHENMRAIGNDTDTMTFIRATKPEAIEAMQALILTLHTAGIAYVADDGVYFSISAYKKAGKRYGQLLTLSEGNTSEARIQNDEYDKESVHDFALWKKQKEDEPFWDFKIGGQDLKGRPGWHIECSAISSLALGQPFDIHTGGIDLIFPHHENEIAQSTATTDSCVMATIFAHNEHILVEGKKMSKSAKNFFTLEDITHKGFEPLAFRLKTLQSHYRSQINFTWESLEAAQNLLNSLRAWADLKHQKAAATTDDLDESYKKALRNMLNAMQDDLNTPTALSAVAELAHASERQGVDKEKVQPMLNIIDTLLGLQLANRPDITHDQKELIADREAARLTKNFQKSDEIRAKLGEQGIGIRDTTQGPIWFKV